MLFMAVVRFSHDRRGFHGRSPCPEGCLFSYVDYNVLNREGQE